MNRKINRDAMRKALLTAVFFLAVFEIAALLVLFIDDLKNYLRMDIRNPAHQAIFAGIAMLIGAYTYFRECMKEKTQPEDHPADKDREEA